MKDSHFGFQPQWGNCSELPSHCERTEKAGWIYKPLFLCAGKQPVQGWGPGPRKSAHHPGILLLDGISRVTGQGHRTQAESSSGLAGWTKDMSKGVWSFLPTQLGFWRQNAREGVLNTHMEISLESLADIGTACTEPDLGEELLEYWVEQKFWRSHRPPKKVRFQPSQRGERGDWALSWGHTPWVLYPAKIPIKKRRQR